jgi:hypothetical protein
MKDSGPTSPLKPEDDAYLPARQASMIVADFLINGRFDLDGQFGKGFAKQHPELFGSYLRAAAAIFAGFLVADKIDGLRESLRSDHPLQGETFADIAAALQSIAEKLGTTERAT